MGKKADNCEEHLWPEEDGLCPYCEIEQLSGMVTNDKKILDLLEMAWVIIANSPDWNVLEKEGDSPCGKRAKTWVKAAEKWRDDYFAIRAASKKGAEKVEKEG